MYFLCKLYEGNKGIATIVLETTVRMKILSMKMFIVEWLANF